MDSACARLDLRADLVGYTSLSSNLSARACMQMLHELFVAWDHAVQGYSSVYKLDTVGVPQLPRALLRAHFVHLDPLGVGQGAPSERAKKPAILSSGHHNLHG